MATAKKSEYLNEKAVSQDLAKLGIEFELLETVNSTNDYLREKAKHGQVKKPCAVVAIHQSEGKGTKGRKWISEDLSGLKMSLCVPSKRSLGHKVALSPAVALATCKALMNLGFTNLELKWPNDLLRNGRKVGGILLESVNNGEETFVITGIGLNLYPSEVVALQLDRQPAFLYKKFESNDAEERTEIVAQVLGKCAETVFDFRFGVGMPEPSQWNKHDRLFNKNVTVKLNSQNELSGVACGIDKCGRFLLRTRDGKLHVLEDGEVEIGYGNIVN
ncbi:MAG: biotin--[acetyl-CoA-carboxylase] ligase [Burkholderiales bacterium]|nr:biotin--[acetyl-CoA-carboxylase] ligase [Burkholderiales bacterium]